MWLNPVYAAVNYPRCQYHSSSLKRYTAALFDLELLAKGKFNSGAYNDSEKLRVTSLKLTDKDTSIATSVSRNRIYYQWSLLYNTLKAYDKILALQRRSLDQVA